MTVLNGNTYTNENFVGPDGRGYVSKFPNPVFDDLLSELSARDATIATLIATQDATITARINALALPGYISLTSTTIGTGSKTFTLTQAASVPVGTYRIYSAGSTTNFMVARVTTATTASTSLQVTVDLVVGSGTFSDWVIVSLSDVARRSHRTTSLDTTLSTSDLMAIIEGTTASLTITADSVSLLGSGFVTTILNSASGSISFVPGPGDTVDGATSLTIPAGRSVTLVSTSAAWRSIDRQVLPHDFLSSHTVSGLTAGHILRATSATTVAFGPLQASDLPAESQRAIRAGRQYVWRRYHGEGICR